MGVVRNIVTGSYDHPESPTRGGLHLSPSGLDVISAFGFWCRPPRVLSAYCLLGRDSSRAVRPFSEESSVTFAGQL